ncbi:DUF488 family protein [Heyndrickxia sporothermodurans]|uniref:DUF488 domain-containing protein n=1 Tax=Heyndrickxia sporothermodurans TaxID=46224 RepID=UPI002DB9CEF9|nr:DUF488 family protein [Heyndrickxia sporothermodurans]MEB6549008.1 DUF488 family protein [Heyndrickxia sporothermodurans]MED3650271.1 DUF488 family protein [Heyndrickxia sporothermodurans]MED3700089.1 DUF488 family protein [Heyndrickxia sporothermodurans]
MITIKRVYEPVNEADGKRVLVDRLWPRGISKEKAKIDEWMKDIAPSNELRKWFNHDPEKFEEFSQKYKEELKEPEKKKELDKLIEMSDGNTVTLVYSAKDEEHNQAVVLKHYLEE